MHDDEALLKDLALIRQSRILFGHQSVGNNLLAGIVDLASAQAVGARGGIEIQSLSDLRGRSSEAWFLETPIGQNTKPETKCSAFARSLLGLKDQLPEIAFMKFCFVDFGQGMTAEEIFSRYASMADSLKQMYPSVTFIHVTAPLTARGRGVKAFLRRVLGRAENYESDNAERGRFNALVRERFAPELIFDLARIESTRPDGSRETFIFKGGSCEGLVPGYTDDGGHLNEPGRRRAARELIRVLSDAVRARRENAALGLPKI